MERVVSERDKRKSGLGAWLMRDPSIKVSVYLVRGMYGGVIRTADFILRRRARRAHDDIVAKRARRIGKK